MSVIAADTIEQLAAAVGALERRETHGSWVLLTHDRAYKVKKPVVLDFLDYGTLERRRTMCRAEVEQNRRGAPDIYVGVRAIVSTPAGVALADEDATGAIEYAVEMRRFDENATLAATLSTGGELAGVVERVGHEIAAYHARSALVEGSAGAEPLQRTIADNFASLGTLLAGDAAARRRLAFAERFAAGFLGARAAQLDARATRGRTLDGHGDLRAEHVLLEQRIQLVDAIEFDPTLRRIDAGLDLAFLVMDLHRLGRTDLAQRLVRAYRAAGGDPGDDALVAFFASYRAQVRAKVALIRAGQESADAASAAAEAIDLLRLAERLAWRAFGPVVLAVCGPSASGKTTLAAALSMISGLPHFSSDIIRKRKHGLAPTARAPAEAYSASADADTYRELGRLAAAGGSGVIVDATFRRRDEREAFRSALGADPTFIECRVSGKVLEARAAARLTDPNRVSDATPAVALRQLAEFEPLDEVPARAHLIVRADRDPIQLACDIGDALGARLCGSPAAMSRISH